MRNKLHKIQKELKAPKGQNNDFGKYKFRSCEDILEGVKKVLPEGVTVSLSDEMVFIGDRYYVKATAIVADETDSLQTTAFARETDSKKGMDLAQVTGSASSYARKYALNGLFAIDDTKDADTNEHRKQKQEDAAKHAAEEVKQKRKEAETWTNEYMNKVDDCKDERDLMNLQTEGTNNVWLQAMRKRHSDLADKIEVRSKAKHHSFTTND